MDDTLARVQARVAECFPGDLERIRGYLRLPSVSATGEGIRDVAAATGALEASLAVVSNRIGTVARNLGAYAAIFTVVTMISGIYGMNFAHMPELAWRFGYAWALGLMVVSAGALWVYFKRKGWL